MDEIEIQNKEKKKLERNYFKKNSKKIYTVLEELDFHWDIDQLAAFRDLWKKGISLLEITKILDRSEEEVALLIMDQAMRGYVRPRKGGLFGWNVNE